MPSDGQCSSSATRNRAHIVSPTAIFDGRQRASTSSATIATGSSTSSHRRSSNTPGWGTTRGASRRGMTIVASPSRGTTSIVNRSSGIAS